MSNEKKPDDEKLQSGEDSSIGDDWAAAFAEQEHAEEDSAADDWAAALMEQKEESADKSSPADDKVFKPLESGGSKTDHMPRELDMVMDIPVKLNVVLGRTRITIKQLLELSEGSVVELDGLAGDPLDILINDYLVAQGEVVVVDDKYGIRITDIVTPSERIHKLNR